MKRKLLVPLLAMILGWMLGTFLAPLAIEIVIRILEPDYRIPRGTCSRGYPFNDSPTERETRKNS